MIKSSSTSCEMPPWVIFHIPHDSTVIPSEVRVFDKVGYTNVLHLDWASVGELCLPCVDPNRGDRPFSCDRYLSLLRVSVHQSPILLNHGAVKPLLRASIPGCLFSFREQALPSGAHQRRHWAPSSTAGFPGKSDRRFL